MSTTPNIWAMQPKGARIVARHTDGRFHLYAEPGLGLGWLCDAEPLDDPNEVDGFCAGCLRLAGQDRPTQRQRDEAAGMLYGAPEGYPRPGEVAVELPRRFYEDHVARGLPSGRLLRRRRAHLDVALLPAELAELLDDAQHYATGDAWDSNLMGLRASARATVKRLQGIADHPSLGLVRA